jgi:hypothetical protein
MLSCWAAIFYLYKEEFKLDFKHTQGKNGPQSNKCKDDFLDCVCVLLSIPKMILLVFVRKRCFFSMPTSITSAIVTCMFIAVTTTIGILIVYFTAQKQSSMSFNRIGRFVSKYCYRNRGLDRNSLNYD